MAFTPVIPDVSFLGHEWQEVADGCLWGLAPQSSPSPICAVYPSSAFGEHWEPRLPAKNGRRPSFSKAAAHQHSPSNNGRAAEVAISVVGSRRRPKRSFDFRWRGQAALVSLDLPKLEE